MSKIAPGYSLRYIKTPYDRLWKFTINAFKVGDKPKFPNGAKNSFNMDTKVAYLDSFSPYIYVPKNGGVEIFSKILHEITYTMVDGLLMGPCDKSKYDTISLFINDRYYFKLSPESYVLDIGYGDKCFLPFQYNQEDYWVLGEPFFRNFYTVFDAQKGIIGIAPSANVSQASIFEGVVPTDDLPHP